MLLRRFSVARPLMARVRFALFHAPRFRASRRHQQSTSPRVNGSLPRPPPSRRPPQRRRARPCGQDARAPRTTRRRRAFQGSAPPIGTHGADQLARVDVLTISQRKARRNVPRPPKYRLEFHAPECGRAFHRLIRCRRPASPHQTPVSTRKAPGRYSKMKRCAKDSAADTTPSSTRATTLRRRCDARSSGPRR